MIEQQRRSKSIMNVVVMTVGGVILEINGDRYSPSSKVSVRVHFQDDLFYQITI